MLEIQESARLEAITLTVSLTKFAFITELWQVQKYWIYTAVQNQALPAEKRKMWQPLQLYYGAKLIRKTFQLPLGLNMEQQAVLMALNLQ